METRKLEKIFRDYLERGGLSYHSYVEAVRKTTNTLGRRKAADPAEISEFWLTALYVKHHAELRDIFEVADVQFYKLFEWIENEYIPAGFVRNPEFNFNIKETYSLLMDIRKTEKCNMSYIMEGEQIILYRPLRMWTCPVLVLDLAMLLDDVPGRRLFVQECEIDDIYGACCYMDDVDTVRGFTVENKKLITLDEGDSWRFIDAFRRSDVEKDFKNIFADHFYWVNNIAKKEDDDIFKKIYYNQ